MKAFLTDKKILAECRIYTMLCAAAKKKHLSFHTPGHKIGKWDITELSFSDNLSAPRGCILQAEKEIAEILGAKKSFILTDGSTSGVFSMLHAAKSAGVKKLLVIEPVHKSVYNACAVLGVSPSAFVNSDEFFKNPSLLQEADGILCTSPDYYGNVAKLKDLRALCDKEKKLLIVDGAHGGHLHFDKPLYAGAFADIWVDGVHKDLPAFTQGAVVSAKNEKFADLLQAAVDIFRTTSPSYPIMASVEYAVKYPKNPTLETAVRSFAEKHAPYAMINDDWTKLCIPFGEKSFEVEKQLEREGVFAEFCDGNAIVFYLSPATKTKDFKRLCKRLEKLFELYPLITDNRIPAPSVLQKIDKTAEVERLDLEQAVGRIAASDCGLFPPCTPLIRRGEKIEKEKIELLQKANNVFGIIENRILVFKQTNEE